MVGWGSAGEFGNEDFELGSICAVGGHALYRKENLVVKQRGAPLQQGAQPLRTGLRRVEEFSPDVSQAGLDEAVLNEVSLVAERNVEGSA
jgi:hypothetical protein